MRISSTIGAILFALPICRGTFFILDPPIHNADLNAQTVSPCGGYKLDSSEPRRDYPQNGLPLHMNSTESSGEWNFEYNSALKEDSWVSLGPDFKQHHTTDFCIPSMPISSDLVGEKGVIRVSQATANGQLFYLVHTPFRICIYIKLTWHSAFRSSSLKGATIRYRTHAQVKTTMIRLPTVYQAML